MPESSVDDPVDGRDLAEAPAARPALIMGQPDTRFYLPANTHDTAFALQLAIAFRGCYSHYSHVGRAGLCHFWTWTVLLLAVHLNFV